MNEKHFKESFMKYKFGRANIFRIRHMYKCNMDVKEPITNHMYPYATYGPMLENPNRTWKQICYAMKSFTTDHVNCQYNYHMLCNEIHENVQEKLKMWKKNKSKYESFKIKVEPYIIGELFDGFDSAIQFSKSGSSYIFKNQYTDLKVSKMSKRTNMIEVVEPEVEKLKPFFGIDFCSFPFQHPNEGAIGQSTNGTNSGY